MAVRAQRPAPAPGNAANTGPSGNNLDWMASFGAVGKRYVLRRAENVRLGSLPCGNWVLRRTNECSMLRP